MLGWTLLTAMFYIWKVQKTLIKYQVRLRRQHKSKTLNTKITLRSTEVKDAINHYWKLRANHPDLSVKIPVYYTFENWYGTGETIWPKAKRACNCGATVLVMKQQSQNSQHSCNPKGKYQVK